MEQVCPICNGLVICEEYCKKCGSMMEEKGRMEDYKGPYSPYMDQESFVQDNHGIIMGDNQCIHLYYCEKCGHWEHKAISPQFF